MIRGRRRGIESIRVLPQGSKVVIEMDGAAKPEEFEAVGRALASEHTVVFIIAARVTEVRP